MAPGPKPGRANKAQAPDSEPKLPGALSGWSLVRRPSGEKPRMDSRAALLLAGAGGFLLGLTVSRVWAWLPRLRNFQSTASENRQRASGAPAPGGAGSRASSTALPMERMAGQYDEYKMLLVVRNDLKMGKGKIGAQCGHATLGLYKQIVHRAPKSIERWEESGQTKIVVKVESEEEMLIVQSKARAEGIPTHITIDAGRTQIAPNSRTVMALLGPEEVLNRVTAHLKLL